MVLPFGGKHCFLDSTSDHFSHRLSRSEYLLDDLALTLVDTKNFIFYNFTRTNTECKLLIDYYSYCLYIPGIHLYAIIYTLRILRVHVYRVFYREGMPPLPQKS